MWPFPRKGQPRKHGVDNFGQVTPWAFRGAAPSYEAVSDLSGSLGLRRIIDLRLPDKDSEAWKRRLSGIGIRVVSYPQDDHGSPDVALIRAAVSEIEHRAAGPLLVHCQGGRHRTGAVVAAYRCWVEHWTAEDAYKEAVKYGFYGWSGHGEWEKFIRNLSLKG